MVSWRPTLSNRREECELRLLPLMDGKLYFAEKIVGIPTNGDIAAFLRKAGIVDGILFDSFSLLQRNDVSQIPVAKAYYQEEPPIFNLFFGINSFLPEILRSILEGTPLDCFEEKFLVKRNEALLTAQGPFRKVLRYPDGHVEIKENLNFNDLQIFCGKNCTVYENSIIALTDGSAHQTKDGRVFTYPVVTVKGVGEIHGKVNEEISVKVTEDIHSHSYLELPSNLFVLGAIHSSFIKVKGNLQALEGIDNPKELSSSKIFAQGKLITPFIKKMKIQVKDKIMVTEGIHNSLVICNDQVWANFIENSEIRLRNGLITNHILGNSRIFLGPSYTNDDELTYFRNQIDIWEKKLNSQEFLITGIRDRLEKEKYALMGYFLRLKEAGKKQILLDSSIVRLFDSIKHTFDNYKKLVEEYQQFLNNYLANKAFLTVCQRNLNKVPFFIKVYGKIDPGVLIATPTHVVKVSKPLNHVLIIMDPLTGRLRFTNDFEETEKKLNIQSNELSASLSEKTVVES